MGGGRGGGVGDVRPRDGDGDAAVKGGAYHRQISWGGVGGGLGGG